MCVCVFVYVCFVGKKQVPGYSKPQVGGEPDQPLLALRHLAVDCAPVSLPVHHCYVNCVHPGAATSQG